MKLFNKILGKWERWNSVDGAAYVVEGALAFGEIHDDGTWQYFGEAVTGTGATEAKWRVSRIHKTTSKTEWADGDSNFDNLYTSYAVVTGLVYS